MQNYAILALRIQSSRHWEFVYAVLFGIANKTARGYIGETTYKREREAVCINIPEEKEGKKELYVRY